MKDITSINQPKSVEHKKTLRKILPKVSGVTLPLSPPTPSISSSVSRFYRCYNCVATFRGFRTLRRHIQEKHVEQLPGISTVFICPYCHLCWDRSECFEKHIILNHKIKMYQCLRCKYRRYKSKGRLLQHCMKVHQDDTIKYFCGQCDNQRIMLTTQYEVEEHFKFYHKKDTDLDYSFEFNHIQLNDLDMQVEFLDNILLSPRDDNSLEFAEYLDDLDFTLPELLEMDYNYLPNLNENAIVVPITEPAAAFPCPKCNSFGFQECSFKHPHELIKHLVQYHDYPTVTTQTSNEKTSTLAYNDTRETNSYPCPYCDKIIMDVVKLRQHLRIVHTQYKKHVCQLCDRQFSTVDHLKKHVLSQHENERKYHCNICDKHFTQSSHLQQHLSIHSSNKKFLCENCNKKFWRKIDLTRHTVKSCLT